MGIVEQYLGDVKLSDGTKIRIEYNYGDIIHLHIGMFRIDFSPKEFILFAEAIKEGKKDLEAVKHEI